MDARLQRRVQRYGWDKAAAFYRDHGYAALPPTLSEDDLGRIRQRRAELFAEWEAVPAGGTLELAFDPAQSHAPSPTRA